MNKIKYRMSFPYRPAFWLRCLWSVNWGIKTLGAFSLYLIIVITFDVSILKIGYSVAADKYNSIFLNLSYSVVAAVIFHLLVVHIPYYKKKEVYIKRIKRQIDYMKGKALYMCLAISDDIHIPEDIDKKKLFDIISTSFHPEYSFVPVSDINGTPLGFTEVKLYRHNLSEAIRLKEALNAGFEEILKYDDYADVELVECIMEVKGSSYFNFMNTELGDSVIVINESSYNYFVRSLVSTIKTIRNIEISN